MMIQYRPDQWRFITSGVKHDPRLHLWIDTPWFVAVLFRGYEALYRVDKNYFYLEKLEQDLNFAWDHARDKYGFVTKSWTSRLPELGKPKMDCLRGC